MQNKPSPTVIVIGAGLAGLAASLKLTQDGYRIIVLEATDSAGGCCSNACDAGFMFNNGAIYVAVPSLLRNAFGRLGLDLDREVPMNRIQSPHVSYLDDGSLVSISSVEASYVEGTAAKERTAALREGLHALQKTWGPVYRRLVKEILPFEPSLPRALARLWRYVPRMGGAVDKLIAKHFRDPGLQAAVASTLLYTGTSPEHLPAPQIIGLLALLEEGFHLPCDGMGAISDALLHSLERQGGCIRTGALVERIDVGKGAVRGVVLADGERIDSSQVIATCSGFEVVKRLLPESEVPARLERVARKAPLSHRAIAIQLGCSGAQIPHAFIVNHVPVMQRQGEMHMSVPGIPKWLAYTHPTAVNQAMAPEGKSVIELFAPVSGIHAVSDWTRAMTESVAGKYIEAIATRLPGLAVEVKRILDPQDFANKRHLYEGALYGIAPGVTPDKLFPHRTGIEGLHLAGQTTFPGYGVSSAIMSGIQAADQLQ